jgi:two-component system response regulator FixJ
MPTEPIIHIVDDDAGVRRSLERLLASADLAAISYSTPRAFLSAAPTLGAGCVLLDLRLPNMNGLEVQARLIELGVLLPVIIMTVQGDVPAAVRAMKAGAVDFLEKPYDDGTLLDAIGRALKRQTSVARRAAGSEATRRIAALSRREREVLDGLVAGRSNKVIAHELRLSVRTVEVHRARMMERLGVRQLAEAVRLSVTAGLTGSGS